ncbi:MAG: site-2 protease family protein [Chloroflexi bacterium HGW-Chloroflexi-6]|nr:MAG: site-2 protease family protein [Chloroflexi bacterium HGW-Chloroflexi-6]
MLTLLVVLLGWLLSLALHEFSHAFVAYHGGDYTVKDKGYLDFDLFKYTHPVYSFLLPMIILIMGGIGLPGGAVYIETWRLRSRWWETAVSLAGPTSNLVIAIGLSIVLQFDFVANSLVGPGLAFLALLQVTAALFNMLPIPPFDGYGALRPHLNTPLRMQIDNFGRFSLWIVILLFWYVPVVSDVFWTVVYIFAGFINIPIDLSWLGYDQFMFWK